MKRIIPHIIPKSTLLTPRSVLSASSTRPACYRVDDAKVMITTYEQSQVNPLLEKNNGDTFQHPQFVKIICDMPNCQDKICDKPCGKVIEHVDVGHGTHSSSFPGVHYISNVDCAGQERAEYMVSYATPIKNTTAGLNVNEDKTANLYNNKEALNNVHMNASRQPPQKTYTGSDDPTNIN